MVTLGIALQVVGVVVVLFGAIAICVGGIPKKNVARAHGTYGGAQTIWRALGREHGYTKGGLSMTVVGAVINVIGLVAEVSCSTGAGQAWVFYWTIPLLVGFGGGVLGYWCTSWYASRVAEEWGKLDES